MTDIFSRRCKRRRRGGRENATPQPRDGAPVARRRSGAPAPCTAQRYPPQAGGGRRTRQPREAQRRSQRRAKRAAEAGAAR